jgi:iron complex outermembrane receptor protein
MRPGPIGQPISSAGDSAVHKERPQPLNVSLLMRRCIVLCVCWWMTQPATVCGADSAMLPDFTVLSIEELMNYEITSVSKKPQKLSETAAAVFVITQEDIRRSGFTTLPDLLRMVPGMQVAKSDPGDYAVSARGFLGEFANKLLVLVDGRSIYSPLF